MQANSRSIESNQAGIHDSLEKVVNKHLTHEFKKPIADHTRQVFELIDQQIKADPKPLIFDACCGVGDSSRYLAKQYPDHWVVGIDKSADRLNRERTEPDASNLILARADLNDFYRLAVAANWQPELHKILYPNPWPKSAHLQRRWHGSAAFPSIVALGGQLEMRSNWPIYLEEFAKALEIAGHKAIVKQIQPEPFITPFEKKYVLSGQAIYQLQAQL
ncbi:SAM-dependent methyltransferase [Saccharobesus litoralis]|uniref:tRNA (guanine(46)-N(7))-methyltransferase n=1 Tax=Saccharobesus litoralis TaxID=2172099 RepID=A0A2S0VST1_9ALTE|nr:SAM-dependent methyltransferase [Saccharobesus litoralis]AWB67271.1 SAM-dependent methyltransferase [Saccharobesus litoralis]